LKKIYPLKNLPSERPPISIEAYLLQFTILTAARPLEARHLRWDEVKWEDKLWELPWQRTKTGRKTKQSHVIVLSEAALAILKTVQTLQNADGLSEYVFAQQGTAYLKGSIGKPPSDATVRTHLARLIDPSEATVHGFRSTFSSWANDNNYPREAIEMALGHVVGNHVERIYARDAKRLNQRRDLMEAWAQFCFRTEPLPAEVVQFRQNQERRNT
jgi:integrase